MIALDQQKHILRFSSTDLTLSIFLLQPAARDLLVKGLSLCGVPLIINKSLILILQVLHIVFIGVI